MRRTCSAQPPGDADLAATGLWWCCPFHDDRNPSFTVQPGEVSFHCFGCGKHGDAATLLMHVKKMTFPEAIENLMRKWTPSGNRASRSARPTKIDRDKPLGLPRIEAQTFLDEAEARLWSAEGAEALAYLKGPRCLRPDTIRAARLGWAPIRLFPVCDGSRGFRAAGIVIPWFVGEHLALVTIRQSDNRQPKYCQVFRHPARIVCYPSLAAIRPRRPFVVVEGEFEALLLGQELGELASVVTLGSASARPAPANLTHMMAAQPWFIATDADDAGDRAVGGWPARARRVRPPKPFKDWTDAKVGGVDLVRLWQGIIAGSESLPLCARVDRPAAEPAPEIAVDRPAPERSRPASDAVVAAPEEPAVIENENDGDEIQGMLRRLNARGIVLDGTLVHPTVKVGTVTGRVTYSKPALQILPKADRPRQITPVVPGRTFVRADYGQIEPRILLEILRRRGLITWDAGEDLYRDLVIDSSVDRETAKRAVNKVMNSSRSKPGADGRWAEFIEATEAYRARLASGAQKRGYVKTLAGRRIPLATDVWNHGGKAVSRVVQGTAADIFNSAAVAVDRAIREHGLPAAVAFLIHDEMWVEADEPVDRIVTFVRAEMEAAALAVGVTIPVQIELPS